MDGIHVHATGRYVPKSTVTNDMFAQIVDTNDEWIKTRTGITSRHFADADEDTSTMSVAAAKNALEGANIDKEKIGVIIVATFTPDHMVPNTACIVQKELGLREEVLAFDLNAACSGFIYAVHTAQSLLASCPDKYALVIGCDTLSKVVDFSDRSSCILFGDGAGAAIISLSDTPSYFQAGAIGDTQTICCPGVENVGTPFSSSEKKQSAHHIFMNGRETFRFAVESIQKCVEKILEQSGKTIEQIDSFVFHQANMRILSSAAKKLGADESKFYSNMDHVGNTSAASIPIALDEMNKGGLLSRGMTLLCAGFGGGLTYGALQFVW